MEAGSIASPRGRSSSQPILINRSRSLISLSDSWTPSSTLHGFGKTYSSKGKKMRGLGLSDKKTIKTKRGMGSSEGASSKAMHGFGWNVAFTREPKETRLNEFLDEHLVSIRLRYSQLGLARTKPLKDPFPDIDEISTFGSQEDLRTAKSYTARRSFSADSGRKDSLDEIPNFGLTPYWAGFVRGVYPNSLAVDDLAKHNYNAVQQDPSSEAKELSDFSKHIPETDVSGNDVEVTKSSEMDIPVTEVKAQIEESNPALGLESDLTQVCDNGNAVVPENRDFPDQSQHVLDPCGYTPIGDHRDENEIVELNKETENKHADTFSSNTVPSNELPQAMVPNQQYDYYSDGSDDTLIPTDYPLILNEDEDNELELKKITYQEYHEPQAFGLVHRISTTSDILEGISDSDSSKIFNGSSFETQEHNLYSNSIKANQQEDEKDLNPVQRFDLAPMINRTSDILEGMSDSDLTEMLYGSSVQADTKTSNYTDNNCFNPALVDQGKTGSVQKEELVNDLDSIRQYENIMIPNYGDDTAVSETSSVDNVDKDISLESATLNTQGIAGSESPWERSNSLTAVDVIADDGIDSSFVKSTCVFEPGAQPDGLVLPVCHDNNQLHNSIDDTTYL